MDTRSGVHRAMIDLHCHILPKLDDGPDNAAESADMCRLAADEGITDIIATPHVFEDRHDVNLDHRDACIEKFNTFLHQRGLKLNLHPGAEVRLVPKLGERLRAPQRLCLNGSRYMLLELPPLMPATLEEELYSLQLRGCVPILAHPERHECIQRNPDFLLHLASSGVLTQITAQSLLGGFGEPSRRCAELLVQNRTAHFVASDAHSSTGRPPLLAAARGRIEHIAGPEEARAMFEDRPRAVLRNRPVHVHSPLPSTPRTIPDLIERLATLL